MSGGAIVKGPESRVASRKFQTVTGRDFGRANAWSKQRGNPVASAIRAAAPVTTPDGLLISAQEGVGLVVSAAEHNFMVSRWQAAAHELLAAIKARLPEGQWQKVAEEMAALAALKCTK